MEEDGVGGGGQKMQPVSAAIKGGKFEVTKFIARNISWIFIRWGQVRLQTLLYKNKASYVLQLGNWNWVSEIKIKVRKRLINFNLCKSCCIQTHFFWFSMASFRYVDKSSLRREEKGKKKLASLCTQLIWNAQKRWNSFKRSHLSLPLFSYSRWRRRRRRLQRRSFGLDFKHLTPIWHWRQAAASSSCCPHH